MTVKVHEIRGATVLCDIYSLPQLPVSLTVQLIGPDENGSRLLCCLEQNEVGRDALVLMDLDDVSNTQIRGIYLFECSILLEFAIGSTRKRKEWVDLLVFHVIQLFVFSHPLDVIKFLLDDRDAQNENQWGDICEQKTYSKN